MAEAEQNTEEKKPDEKTKVKDEKIKVKDLTAEGAAKDANLRFTKRIYVEWTDDDGVTHQGEFSLKRATVGDKSRVGTIMADLREDKPLSALDWRTAALHEAMAVCTVCVTQSPPWFKPLEMYDEDPLMRVYQEVRAFQDSFRKPLG